MENIKAAFFDIDGTLLSHRTKEVPKSARLALEKLRDRGVKIFMATGRPLDTLLKLPLDGLKFDGYIIKNGQECFDENMNRIAFFDIRDEALEELVDLFNNSRYIVTLVQEGNHYINRRDNRIDDIYASISTPCPPVGTYHSGNVSMGVVYITEEETEELAALLPHCKIARWHKEGVDIINRDSGKAVGIEIMLKRHGLDRSEMIAFGDACNDREMLEYAQIGVAMGNGVDALKEAADYITTDIDDDGIYNALKYYRLID